MSLTYPGPRRRYQRPYAVFMPGDGPACGQPRPEWVRGVCPQCGGMLIARAVYLRNHLRNRKDTLVLWECWNRLSTVPTCSYRIV